MCGIVGTLLFETSPGTVDEDLLARMRDAMQHRGPDGAGLWLSPDRRIGLAHRRLSIIDLSDAASQPMCNEDGSLWLTFNGEIYNHAEIRAELMRIGGHCWKTDHSDTEVILHAFEEWGIDCLHRFRGMFAFAIWDAREKALWLVRDRIGVKPLYYSVHHGRISFASEIKALLADPKQHRAVNEEALYHYLSFHSTPAPLTMFEGIFKVEAGTWVQFKADGGKRTSVYWDVWDHAANSGIENLEEASTKIRSELETSVRLRAISDVPVGIFLSGGIDSSTNAALFSQDAHTSVKTFSIGYTQDFPSYRNEFGYARLVAESIGSDHHERRLSLDDLINFLPHMVWHQDEPLADPVCVPVYYVSELARQNGIVVAQVGEGADELFWGYPAWKTMLRLQNIGNMPIPRIVKSLLIQAATAGGKGHRRSIELLKRNVANQPIFWGGFERFTETQKARLLSTSFKRRLSGLSSWHAIEPIWQRFQANAWETSTLHWMTYLDLKYRLPELLLMRVDKMSMAASIEARVPFLDHRFTELVLSLPEHLKTQNGELKAVLRQSVRGLIPDTIIDRRKQGFGVPIQDYLVDRLGALVETELRDFCSRNDFFDFDYVQLLLRHRDAGALWTLLNLSLWWRRFIANEEYVLRP